MVDLITFRDTIREISPRWLRNGFAQKFLYSLGIHMDLLGDAAASGVKKAFPLDVNSGDSLGAIGRNRKIERGPNEPDATYSGRLVTWLDRHRTRGNPYTLLQEWHEFWAATPFTVDLVYQSGKRYHMALDGTVTVSFGPTWDDDTTDWARWWIVIDWPSAVNADGLWSSPGTWDDGGVWDCDVPLTTIMDLRTIPNAWNAGHCIANIVLRAAGIELWDFPLGPWSDAGTWAGGTPFVLEFRADGY